METTFRHITRITCLAWLCTGLAPAQEAGGEQDWDVPRFELEEPLVTQAGEFSFTVFGKAVERTEGNVVFSPASLENLLCLLRELSAGEVREHLDTLPLSGGAESPLVHSAEGLFMDSDLALKPGFSADTVVPVPMQQDPTAAAERMNQWCATRTEGRIPHVVSPEELPESAAVAAVSALHFAGEWAYGFNQEATKPALFHQADGKDTPVQMMRQEKEFRYAEDPDGEWRAVALPYIPHGGTRAYFIGILPKGDARDFARTLTPGKYSAILSLLQNQEETTVDVHLPMIGISQPPLDLRDVLNESGLPLFSPAKPFHVSFVDEPVYLGSLRQTCSVEINHQGTTAKAVTQGCFVIVGLKHTVTMEFNRPFVWFIAPLSPNSLPWFMGLYEKAAESPHRATE